MFIFGTQFDSGIPIIATLLEISMFRGRRPALFVAALALALALAGAPAVAAVINFELDFEFSGATPPEGVAPWATATFDDSFGGLNTVRLTMSAGGLVDGEFLSRWYFNLDPALNPNSLSFAVVDTSAVASLGISTGADAFKADGDGLYDILFKFPPPPGSFASKFTSGESLVLNLTYVTPISASSFNFLSASAGGKGPFKSAAHVQGIGPADADSGWITVPEPIILWLVGAGLLALAFVVRRHRTRA